MRTTLTIEDRTARELKEIAHRTGKSFKDVVNETLQAGLKADDVRRPKRYRIRPASLGNVVGEGTLDKALAIADALEDEEIARKLEQRR
jgi:hypothetical protein